MIGHMNNGKNFQRWKSYKYVCDGFQAVLIAVFFNKLQHYCQFCHSSLYRHGNDISFMELAMNCSLVMFWDVVTWQVDPNLILLSIFNPNFLDCKCVDSIFPHSQNKHTWFNLLFCWKVTDNIGKISALTTTYSKDLQYKPSCRPKRFLHSACSNNFRGFMILLMLYAKFGKLQR